MKFKKLVLTLAALSGFFITQNSWATCSNYTTYVDGDVLTAGSLNSLQSNYTNCVNDVLNGDNFTGTINLYSAADFNVYSDAGTTLKFTVDGATGIATVSGSDTETGVTATSNDASFISQNKDATVNNYQSYEFKNDTGTTVGRIANVNLDHTAASEDTEFDFVLMTAGAMNSPFAIRGNDIAVGSGGKVRLDGSFTGDTYLTESSANVISAFAGGSERFNIQSSQVNVVGADFVIPATKRFYLDGGSDTYFTESSNNTVKLFVGTVNTIENTPIAFDLNNVTLSIDTTKDFFLDGGSNTSIRESAADTMAFKLGGNDRIKIHSNGEIEGTAVDPPTANYMNPNGVVKAWGRVADTNGSVTGYNVSFGSYSSGSTVINFGTDFSSSTSYAVTITPRCGFDVNWRITAKAAGSFTVQTNAVSSGSGTNCGFDFMAIGTQ